MSEGRSTARIVTGVEDVDTAPSVVAIGFFDGVHGGHQTIIRRALDSATARGVRSAVVTFDRHPMEVIRPGSQPRLLMTAARRTRTLAEQGLDLVVVLPFDDALRHRSPEEFVDHVLTGALTTREVVVGSDFRFGHKAAGDVATLAALGRARGFTVDGVSLLERDGDTISSTEVRRAIDDGDVALAAELLGRPHVIDGLVVRGDGRGRSLGYPTANLQVDPRIAVPARGVYASVVELPDGTRIPAATSVGVNPTFGGQEVRVEAHLLDFDADLYGTEVGVDFRRRLRGEERFAAVGELVAAIDRDIAEVRQLLDA